MKTSEIVEFLIEYPIYLFTGGALSLMAVSLIVFFYRDKDVESQMSYLDKRFQDRYQDQEKAKEQKQAAATKGKPQEKKQVKPAKQQAPTDSKNKKAQVKKEGVSEQKIVEQGKSSPQNLRGQPSVGLQKAEVEGKDDDTWQVKTRAGKKSQEHPVEKLDAADSQTNENSKKKRRRNKEKVSKEVLPHVTTPAESSIVLSKNEEMQGWEIVSKKQKAE